jgi:hypothetical protein
LSGIALGKGSISIALKDINDFAGRTQMIVVDAYDGEGYLIWRRL